MMNANIPENATRDEVIEATAILQRYVTKVVPEAKLLYVNDKKGLLKTIAIFDCKIVLNHLGHIDFKNCQAPQRISDCETFYDTFNETTKGVTMVRFLVWFSAFHRLVKLGMIDWRKFMPVSELMRANLPE